MTDGERTAVPSTAAASDRTDGRRPTFSGSLHEQIIVGSSPPFLDTISEGMEASWTGIVESRIAFREAMFWRKRHEYLVSDQRNAYYRHV